MAFGSCRGPNRPMATQILKPNQVVQPRKLARILPRLVPTHPNTFLTKICNEPVRWGGGPENVTKYGGLSKINPKMDPIKEPWGHPFWTSYELPWPVRSHRGQKSGSGNRVWLRSVAPHRREEFSVVERTFGGSEKSVFRPYQARNWLDRKPLISSEDCPNLDLWR